MEVLNPACTSQQIDHSPDIFCSLQLRDLDYRR